ncbi:MAG: hypothetical protein WC124_14910 [Desulfoplanes sp.]
MHGIYYYLEPLFMVFLMLVTTAALYMGIFKADHTSTSFSKKIFSGIASGVFSVAAWSFLYSHHYLGW